MRRLAIAPILVVAATFGLPGCGGARAPAPSPARAGDAAKAADNACRPSSGGAASPFELIVLGSGGPRSFGRAGSGYVIVVDGVARALVDVGPGSFVRLGEMGIDLERLDTILLTHLHIDHSGDVAGFVKSRNVSSGEALTFRFFGPSGAGSFPSTTSFVGRLFGTEGAYAYLPKFRNALTFDVVDLPVAPHAPIREVLRAPDLVVTSIAVDHDDVPAVAFRIEHGGRSVVVSGDLASKNDNLARLADGAELLVYDTAVLDPPGSPLKLYDLHTPPKRIGQVAAAAHVKSLLLSHIPPGVEQATNSVLASIRTSYRGPTRFATDCLRVRVE